MATSDGQIAIAIGIKSRFDYIRCIDFYV